MKNKWDEKTLRELAKRLEDYKVQTPVVVLQVIQGMIRESNSNEIKYTN